MKDSVQLLIGENTIRYDSVQQGFGGFHRCLQYTSHMRGSRRVKMPLNLMVTYVMNKSRLSGHIIDLFQISLGSDKISATVTEFICTFTPSAHESVESGNKHRGRQVGH